MIKRFVVLLVLAVTMSGDISLLQDEGEVYTVTVDGFGSNLRFVPDTLTINEEILCSFYGVVSYCLIMQ